MRHSALGFDDIVFEIDGHQKNIFGINRNTGFQQGASLTDIHRAAHPFCGLLPIFVEAHVGDNIAGRNAGRFSFFFIRHRRKSLARQEWTAFWVSEGCRHGIIVTGSAFLKLDLVKCQEPM